MAAPEIVFAKTVREKHLNGEFPSLETLYPAEFKAKYGETLGAEKDFCYTSNENPHWNFLSFQDFAKVHKLEAGDRLMFTYDRRCHFHVEIYRNKATRASSSAASQIATTIPRPRTSPGAASSSAPSRFTTTTPMPHTTPSSSAASLRLATAIPRPRTTPGAASSSAPSRFTTTIPMPHTTPSSSAASLRLATAIPRPRATPGAASSSGPSRFLTTIPPPCCTTPAWAPRSAASLFATTIGSAPGTTPAWASRLATSRFPFNIPAPWTTPRASSSAATQIATTIPGSASTTPAWASIPAASWTAITIPAPATASDPPSVMPAASTMALEIRVTSMPTVSVIPPASENSPRVCENMKNAARLQARPFKHRHPYGAPSPRVKPAPVRTQPPMTRLGAGALRPIDYSEDALVQRHSNKKRRHQLDEDAQDPPEVHEYKKRCRAGFTLQQHLDLLPQASEGVNCDASVECGSIVSIIILKTATPRDSLLIKYYWSSPDLAFASNWSKLLFACDGKDILLSNQRGKKWRVSWNPGDNEVDHTTTGWSAFVEDHNLQEGDRCDLTILHYKPIEFGFRFIRKPGSKSPGGGITRLLQHKPEEKPTPEGLDRGYGSESEVVGVETRQLRYRSHFRFGHSLSDTGKFGYSSDSATHVTPYPQRSWQGKNLHPRKKFHPGVAARELIIIQEDV